ncbi:hypothetical protein C2E25_16520 [Geothermobacter hydrogeniphilus]|uniref:LPP20 lipoprotein n=2 Tax=Geothermobacter hydrogeniphilus TaxID=1969733 RepID=A0A2K2H5Q8_9BACT|nr:hypothetical protein C2E25_16520 [Geothermobacter hydrogeniphilus]
MLLLWGCAGQKQLPGSETVVETSGGDRPDWVTEVPEDEDGLMFFRGFKTKAVTLEGGLTDARENASRQIIEMIEQRGMADYSNVRVERGIPESDADIGSVINDGLKILSDNVVRGIKERETYFEKVEVFTGSGLKYYYNVFSLVAIPENEYRVAMQRAVDTLKVRAREQNNAKAEAFLDEMNKRFYRADVSRQ